MRTRIAGLFLLLLSGCQSGNGWLSEFRTEHPLVGRIWAVEGQRFISPSELRDAAPAVLLIGEKHDNPDHHRLRRELLLALHEEAGLTLVTLEMLDSTQQTRINEAMAAVTARPDLTAEELKTLLAWDDGWDWDSYSPLVASLMQQGIPLRAANISREQVSEVYRDEYAQSDALNAEQIARLKADIDASHCGMLPPEQFDAMVRVQQARDQSMAESLQPVESLQLEESLRSAEQGIRVLIAGNYHVRKDIGVPRYLPEQSVSVAFLEVAEGVSDPEEYLRAGYAPDAFDFVWFTPASSRQDYCAQLREQD